MNKPLNKMPDVWIVNKKGRMVQVPADIAGAMLDDRAKRGARRASEREIALYHERRARSDKNAADTKTMREKVDALRDAATDASKSVDPQPGEIEGVTYAEAELALKPYDTKAKLIALAAEHGIKGMSDKLTKDQLHDGVAEAIISGRIPFESL